ncbi:MAG: hypothetical protein WCR87_08320 [Saccharofermentanales bacterium]
MKCRSCGKENPEDSIYCEFCGDDIRILSAAPAKSTPVNLHGKTVRRKPNKVSVLVLITAALLLSATMIWVIVRITSPGIMMTDDGKYDDYKYYAKNAQSIEYTLLNNYDDDFDYADEIEIPLSDIEGNWYVLLRTYENGSDDFAAEAEYTAVIEAKDSFDVKLTCTLFDGYNADGSEFKPVKWNLRTAKGSFYQNILALHIPGKSLELVFKPNRLINGEQGFFMDVAYDEKSFLGKTTLYQMIIVKMKTDSLN